MRTSCYVGAGLSAALCLTSVSTEAAPAALGSGLRELTAAYDRGDANLPRKLSLHLHDPAGNPVVRVHLRPGASAEVVLSQLRASGFHIIARSNLNPSLVEGYLPLSSVHEAAKIDGIRALTGTHRPVRQAGLVQSQAVALEKADRAQTNGFDGTGVKIGVLSDSYNGCGEVCSTDAAKDIATGDLPAAGVTVLEDLPVGAGGEDEGRAMLQLVHDIAPGSQLGFATAFVSEIDFANNILALRSKFGADVIVDDVFYTQEPMFSDGILAQAVNIVSKDGAAYFSSAGNNGAEAWEDTYRPISFTKAEKQIAKGDGDNIKLEQIPLELRPVSFHNFNSSGKPSISQHITTADGNGSFLDLQWDEPFDLGKVKTDYNIYLFDADGNYLDPNTAPSTANTNDDNIATDEPIEGAVFFPDHVIGGAPVGDFQIVIGKINNGPASHLKYVMANTLAVSERQNAPSTFGHATATGARGIAAMYYAIPTFPEDFSSPGPVTIYLDTEGNRLRRPEVRLTPQLTAADGVDTTFFPPGPLFDPDGTGFPNFFGTSAAAPDAAAIGALVLQAAGGSGSLKAQELYSVMENTATPVRVPNVRFGAGAFAGPVALSINADWVRWTQDFSLSVDKGNNKVHSITFNAAPTNLRWSTNPNRFSVSNPIGLGVDISNMTRSVSPDATQFSITFAPGTFVGGHSFDWGMSVFAPIQGSTQELGDRFRHMTMTVTMEDGAVFTGEVVAMPKLPFNNYTGFGLVNADAATRAASSH
jgi:hypothetical protein